MRRYTLLETRINNQAINGKIYASDPQSHCLPINLHCC